MYPEACPNCGTDLTGEPIPESIAHHYSGTRWNRVIGIEMQGLYDGVAYWACPDCEHVWKRLPWVPDWKEPS